MSNTTLIEPSEGADESRLAAFDVPAPYGLPARRGRGWLVRRMLVLADVSGLSLAFVLTEYASDAAAAGTADLIEEIVVFAAMLPIWVLVAKLYGLYDRDEDRADHSTAEDLVGAFNAVSIGTWIFVAVALVTDLVALDLSKIVTFWALAVTLMSASRAAARAICKRQPAYVQRTAIVGTGAVAQRVARNILQHPEYGLEVVGFVDAPPADRRPIAGIPVVGDRGELPELVDRLSLDRLVFAFSPDATEHHLATLRACRGLPVQCDIVPRFFDIVGPGASFHNLGGLPLIALGPSALSRSSQLVKRAVDVVVSAVALVVLAPFFALTAGFIKLDSRGPVFFSQTRIGAGDRPFRIHKFRTMVMDAEEHKARVRHLNHYAVNGGDTTMFKVKDDPRTTRIGRVLRRFSLDELPQLVNVLRGEMSLVGPRPLVVDEDQQISGWGRRRLTVRPGITGPWQVLGRNDIPFDEMVTMDYLYVTNWSLMRDVVLMLRTIPAVVRPRSVY